MKIVKIFGGVLFGVFFTYVLIAQFNIPPVLSSALAGLVGSIFFINSLNAFKEFGIAIYCGSFIGMGSVLTSTELLLAGAIATIILILSSNVFKGYGGKLGFIAYISSVLTYFGLNILENKTYDFGNYNWISDTNSILSIVIASITGFYITILLHHKLDKSSVLASALPSFVIGLLAYTTLSIDLFITTFFSASFVGMLSKDLLPKRTYPLLMVLFIMITIIVKPMLGGFGGALGTLAFLSVGLMVLLKKTIF